ncbi:MAG: DGQHR domain-containing protein [Dehalococcoidia bacterium]|nr:DGQHR domain-containing protein [Dehalococcoidia bacterium]
MPLFMGRQVLPLSSVPNTDGDEMPTHMRCLSRGSRTMEWRQSPPAPGNHWSRVGWLFRPGNGVQVTSSSSVRNSAAGATPQYSTPGFDGRPGSMRHVRSPRIETPVARSILIPESWVNLGASLASVHVLPMSVEYDTRLSMNMCAANRLPVRASSTAWFTETQKLALVPTTVLINIRKPVEITKEGGRDALEIPDDLELWVVDGQHRLEGFWVAIEEQERLRFKDYEVPAVFTMELAPEQEAEQFRVINETAKKVRTDLARRLLAFAAQTKGGRQQIRSQQRMWEATAAKVIDVLNSDPDSPLYRRIQGPNQKKGEGHTIRELSFSTSLRPILNTFPYQDWGPERTADLLCNYWQAWRDVVSEPFDEADAYVLLRTPGIFSLHLVALHLREVCRRRAEEPDLKTITAILEDLPTFTSADYWRKYNTNGAAVFGSMKGFSMPADLIKDELIEKDYTTE